MHLTNETFAIAYSSAVSQDSVTIAFTVADLYNFYILLEDVENAYLNTKPKDKYYITCGDEFSNDMKKGTDSEGTS